MKQLLIELLIKMGLVKTKIIKQSVYSIIEPKFNTDDSTKWGQYLRSEAGLKLLSVMEATSISHAKWAILPGEAHEYKCGFARGYEEAINHLVSLGRLEKIYEERSEIRVSEQLLERLSP